MFRITVEQLNAMRDPVARRVWERWIREGEKAILVPSVQTTVQVRESPILAN